MAKEASHLPPLRSAVAWLLGNPKTTQLGEFVLLMHPMLPWIFSLLEQVATEPEIAAVPVLKLRISETPEKVVVVVVVVLLCLPWELNGPLRCCFEVFFVVYQEHNYTPLKFVAWGAEATELVVVLHRLQ